MLLLLTLLAQPAPSHDVRLTRSQLVLPEIDGWEVDAPDDRTVRLRCAEGRATVILYAFDGLRWRDHGEPFALLDRYRRAFADKSPVQDVKRRVRRQLVTEKFSVPIEGSSELVDFSSGVHVRYRRTVVAHLTETPGTPESCRTKRSLRVLLKRTDIR